jgi:hypothetical protein
LARSTEISPELRAQLAETLGYLNFSSGAHDPKFLGNLNALYAAAESNSWSADKNVSRKTPHLVLAELLRVGIERLRMEPSPLGDATQAQAVVELLFTTVLPRYLEFHRDLLFHQRAELLFTPLFIGRVAQAMLSAGPPWTEAERIAADAIESLNDYIGYRPVAQHRSGRKGEPYKHERVRPVPLYIADVGPDRGRYHDVVALALDILRNADSSVLRAAWFDLDLLDELAYDPRAYDFDHPVHKRPNHHFGQWDLDLIDQRGFFRRFVVQQVTLDALVSRIGEPQRRGTPKATRDELLLEAAAVLAGTVLMGSGTSGNGPECHDSTVTLANLLPRIASYRDAFYADLITRIGGAHAKRLQTEVGLLKQPFGGARHHLNACLARLRAAQMAHVHVAHVYAEMGYEEAARRESTVVPVASARMTCEIRCRLTACERDVDRRNGVTVCQVAQDSSAENVLTVAATRLAEAEDLLKRAIECGATVDPWNITWFTGHFGLFRSIEDSVYDHRADLLIDLLERIFLTYGRLVSEAYSSGDDRLGRDLLGHMDRLADWWDAFATTTTSGVESFSGRELHDSAAQVGSALAAWQKGGAAAGDVAFWRQYVAEFRSPRTFARVVETLLEHKDFVATMALIVQWLSQANEVALEEGDDSFHDLVSRWMGALLAEGGADRLVAARKLLDFIEANAEEYWDPPELYDNDPVNGDRMLRELFGEQGEANADGGAESEDEDEEDDEDDADDLFGAAYENVVFRDSAADGTEGALDDASIPTGTDYEFEEELKRITDRLRFLSTIAGLWKQVAVEVARRAEGAEKVTDAINRWRSRASEVHAQLRGLISSVQRYRIATPSGTFDSYVEFDRRRSIKETLLERIIAAATDAADAVEFLAAVVETVAENDSDSFATEAAAVDRALVNGDAEVVARHWPDLLDALSQKTSLYMPLARSGDPLKMADARALHQRLRQWLSWLPRLGLLADNADLIDTIRSIEVSHPVGPGAVTEFDRLFETGYKSIVDAIILSAESWRKGARGESTDRLLNEAVQTVTEPLLSKWLEHSQTLRLSPLERIDNDKDWKELRAFVESYGHDLFHQQFMNLGNLRAILHPGVDDWIERLESGEDEDEVPSFVADLDEKLARGQAVRHLTMILEAVIDNYIEYRDYNSTTTQSDRGEMLYTFLDFLRVKAAYERSYWNLRPVIMAHEMLVRRGRSEAAELWRRALVDRTSDMADRLVRRLERVQKQYGMRLATVADRIGERFVRPLDADRVLAMVRPAMEEARRRTPNSDEVAQDAGSAFTALEQEIAELTAEPTGAGLDVPDWLAALEDEVDMLQSYRRRSAADPDAAPVPRVKLTFEAVLEQARQMGA